MIESQERNGILPPVRTIGFDSPWNWLAAGWRDVWRTPAVSLSYGAIFAACGGLLTVLLLAFDVWYVVLPLGSGFMLLGPVLGVGLYEVSRRHATGEPVTLRLAFNAWRRNPGPVFALGVVLMLAFLLWVRLATLLFAVVYGSTEFHIDTFFVDYFFSADTIGFLAAGTLIGAFLATVVFSISAVSFPMIIERDIGAAEAVLVSLVAVRRNWRPFVLWAGLVVLFSGAGLVFFYVGLILALPLIGHASFHAYREVVER